MKQFLIKENNIIEYNSEFGGFYNDNKLVIVNNFDEVIDNYLLEGWSLLESSKIAKLYKIDLTSHKQMAVELLDDGKSLIVKKIIDNGQPVTKSYDSSDWDNIYLNLIKMGYSDVSNTYNEVPVKKNTFDPIPDPDIKELFDMIKRENSRNIVANYKNDNIAKTINNNTIYRAQRQIDILKKMCVLGSTKDDINSNLYKLYHIIPRNFSNINDYFIGSDINTKSKLDDLNTLLKAEEDLLNNLKAEVIILKGSIVNNDNFKNKDITPGSNAIFTELDSLGFNIKKATQNEIDYLESNLYTNYPKYNSPVPYEYYSVENKKLKSAYDNFVNKQPDKTKMLLFHGLGPGNLLSTFVDGKIYDNSNSWGFFGKGIYFSENIEKCISYTTSVNGYYYILLFEVCVGDIYYPKDARKAHNTLEHSGNNTLNDLRKLSNNNNTTTLKVDKKNNWTNSEIVIYQDNQCYLKYIIKIKK